MSEQKKLYRSRSERMLGGVCAGLGTYFNIDPVLVRLFFVILTLGHGSGLILYFLLWLLLPNTEQQNLKGRQLVRANANEMADRFRSLLRGLKPKPRERIPLSEQR